MCAMAMNGSLPAQVFFTGSAGTVGDALPAVRSLLLRKIATYDRFFNSDFPGYGGSASASSRWLARAHAARTQTPALVQD
jgi:hypothetical protein